ncbi:MAG: OsmC family protein [Candidatus Brocadiia bacterium]
MEVMVEHESGFRFAATCRGHTVTSGEGEDGNEERDGMWPVQLFEAALGMCIGGYIVEYCAENDIPYEGMTVELSRHMQAGPPDPVTGESRSLTSRINAVVHLDAELTDRQQEDILAMADSCHITRSIGAGLEIDCSLAPPES